MKCGACSAELVFAHPNRRYCSVRCRKRKEYVMHLGYYTQQNKNYKATPAVKYGRTKARAARRHIRWEFTLEEWLRWWGDDFEKRGAGGQGLVMARFNDVGPYAVNNVYKCTRAQNSYDGQTLIAEFARIYGRAA